MDVAIWALYDMQIKPRTVISEMLTMSYLETMKVMKGIVDFGTRLNNMSITLPSYPQSTFPSQFWLWSRVNLCIYLTKNRKTLGSNRLITFHSCSGLS
jgi:hypothetical protein